MRPTIVLTAVVCWSTPCTIAAAQTQCVSFSDSIDGVNKDKDRAVEKSLKSLDEQIEKWKADSGVTGPVTVTAEKPQPHPFWRSSVPSYALLPPDVVSDTAYTICWTGVVSPVVCTSGARVCWIYNSMSAKVIFTFHYTRAGVPKAVIWYLSPLRLRTELRKAGALASLD